MSPVLVPLQNGDNKTILKILEQQFMSVIKLKPKSCTNILNFATILEGEIVRQTEIDASMKH